MEKTIHGGLEEEAIIGGEGGGGGERHGEGGGVGIFSTPITLPLKEGGLLAFETTSLVVVAWRFAGA
jgi:hypothetical protein